MLESFLKNRVVESGAEIEILFALSLPENLKLNFRISLYMLRCMVPTRYFKQNSRTSHDHFPGLFAHNMSGKSVKRAVFIPEHLCASM